MCTTWTVTTTLWIIQHVHHLNSEHNIVNNSACAPPEQWLQCCEQFSTMMWTLTRLVFRLSSLWQAEACMHPHWAVNAQGHKQLSDVLCHHYGFLKKLKKLTNKKSKQTPHSNFSTGSVRIEEKNSSFSCIPWGEILGGNMAAYMPTPKLRFQEQKSLKSRTHHNFPKHISKCIPTFMK